MRLFIARLGSSRSRLSLFLANVKRESKEEALHYSYDSIYRALTRLTCATLQAAGVSYSPDVIPPMNCTKSWHSFVRVGTLIRSAFGFNTRNRLTARLHGVLRAVVGLTAALN